MGFDRRGQRSAAPVVRPDKQTLREIIQGDPVRSARLTDEWGDKLGKAFSSVKSAQIRIIFSYLRGIENRWPRGDEQSPISKAAARDFMLMRARLAYQSGRHAEVKEMAEFLMEAMTEVRDGNREDFQRFVDLFESVLAYHKAAGGKD